VNAQPLLYAAAVFGSALARMLEAALVTEPEELTVGMDDKLFAAYQRSLDWLLQQAEPDTK
jgi:hypothetical protein